MARNWMPIYWGDYHRDTAHLSAAEHGAYLLLIGHYWTTAAPLPNQDARLARIARMAPDEWAAAAETVRAFFYPENGLLRHSRIDEELAKNVAITEERSKAGKRSAANKRRTNEPTSVATSVGTNAATKPEQTTQQKGNIPQPPSPSPLQVKDSEKASQENAGALGEQSGFELTPDPLDPPAFMDRRLTAINTKFVRGGAQQFAGIGSMERPKKNPARADQHLAEHMVKSGFMPADKAWMLIAVARDPDHDEHTDAARQCEKYSRQHKLGWFHAEPEELQQVRVGQ